ncbi:ParB/RepB/Spo0J family partition protein [Pseudaestuariivita atlantica]|uniref:ParB-like N-terminal domain-containing protein n=1 Tax=Pseudaestuariivita atlantica TaxID=1317121 RepID=A0A0L1JKF8_9RHOB|nr:ParB N-terminal domain-containing protein [Pseudaestuariivita atlantica]KNG92244.1 hypothetical protein ATO11_18480 [Pseudaestuariivita atlantica]
MAKRKRLEVPTEANLKEMEEGFARETSASPAPPGLGPVPPIAQVAAEAAAAGSLASPTDRADKAELDRYREALAAGLVVQEIPVDEIVADELMRDRIGSDEADMAELRLSIDLYGVRLPIEVFPLHPATETEKFGLISGWRRLKAVRELWAATADPRHRTIKAFVREDMTPAKAYVAMVEENEIRADLSQYEKGRIAVMAASHGAFETLEDAVNHLYATGSKSKRSKIRSFAELHEELGDMLSFPTALSERQGLRIVAAIRAGYTRDLREVLGTGRGTDPATEWALIETVLDQADAQLKDAPGQGRGGRPRQPKGPLTSSHGPTWYKLDNGITIASNYDSRGHYIRLEGRPVDADMVKAVMAEIKRLLEPR